MSDQLEKHIHRNREMLDEKEPPKGHLDRFSSRLEQQPVPIKKGTKLKWVGIAAGFAAVLGCVWFFNVWTNTPNNETASTTVEETPNNQLVSLSDVSPEMAEVEYYFTESITAGLTKLEKSSVINEPFYTGFKGHLNGLEQQYEQLKTDLSENFGDSRIINAMIQNLRIRMQLMDRMIQQLETIQKQKASHHENNV